MAFSLHTVTVGTHLQFLPSIAGLIDKAEAHCRANGLEDEALSQARLAADMWPFAMQVTVCNMHSLGALEGARRGLFGLHDNVPGMPSPPHDFASLRSNTLETIERLKAWDPAEIDGFVGKDMALEIGDLRLEYLVEDFLLTFALPNFFFHASQAYAILRNQGLNVGKMDYIGQQRLKGMPG